MVPLSIPGEQHSAKGSELVGKTEREHQHDDLRYQRRVGPADRRHEPPLRVDQADIGEPIEADRAVPAFEPRVPQRAAFARAAYTRGSSRSR